MVYIPKSKWTWAFALTVVVQLIVGIALEGYIFAHFRASVLDEASNRAAAGEGTWARAIPTYLSLLIFAFVYELLLVYDALQSQNTIQVIGLVIMNLGIVVYTGIQKDQVYEAYKALLGFFFIRREYWMEIKAYLIALPCIIALFTVILAFIAWKLYGEFGWNIYKQIGADRRLRNRFFIYQIYIALLKFDFFLFLGFEIQFLVLVSNTGEAEKYLTYIAIPITVLLLFLAAYSTKHENMFGMACTLVVYLIMVTYFIFKLVRMYHSPRKRDYESARRTLTVFAVITLVFITVTIVIAIQCAVNFNKGLKPHLNKRPSSAESNVGKQEYQMDYKYQNQTGHDQYGQRPYGGSRMEID